MARKRSGRINARLNAKSQEQVAWLRRRTRRTVTEIVVDSLDLYYRTVKGEGRSAAEILDATGFIGCGNGSPGLSGQYKDELTRLLKAKT
jgi:hypothetical protein